MTITIPEALLPPTIIIPDLAPIVGMSTSSIYASLKSGTFPFPHHRIGGRVIIPTAPIREALGFTTTAA